MSKLEAEYALLRIAAETGMEVVIIRPPLVYGAEAPGNFASLVKYVRRGVPLPFGSVHNMRSLVGIDNLLSLLFLCADQSRSPRAANHVFLVADEEDLSTTELLRRMGLVLGKPARLVPVPQKVLETCLILLGEKTVAQSLLGNLQVDTRKVREVLGWRPPLSLDQGLMAIATHNQRK